MARYIGSVCRLCRREGLKLFLKADRCNSYKCAMEKRAFAPGQHGTARSMRVSEYGLQLREKQKAKRYYCILEKQFKKYFELAEKKDGQTGENLLVFIERRLDNFLVKTGFLKSKNSARQLVVHGHVLVNGKRVDKPSFLLKENDVVKIKDNSQEMLIFKELKESKSVNTATVPSWITINLENFEAKVVRLPNRADITTPVKEQLIVELYSK